MREDNTQQRSRSGPRSRQPGRREQRGAAIIEYSIITFLVVVVLISEPDVIGMLLGAIKQVYGAFTHAISLTFPTPS